MKTFIVLICTASPMQDVEACGRVEVEATDCEVIFAEAQRRTEKPIVAFVCGEKREKLEDA